MASALLKTWSFYIWQRPPKIWPSSISFSGSSLHVSATSKLNVGPHIWARPLKIVAPFQQIAPSLKYVMSPLKLAWVPLICSQHPTKLGLDFDVQRGSPLMQCLHHIIHAPPSYCSVYLQFDGASLYLVELYPYGSAPFNL